MSKKSEKVLWDNEDGTYTVVVSCLKCKFDLKMTGKEGQGIEKTCPACGCRQGVIIQPCAAEKGGK